MDRISMATALFTRALVLKSIGGDKIEFIGVTTTALTEGSTTNPITIDGDTVTAVSGNVAIYGNDAFIFNGTEWQVYSDMSDIETRLEAVEGDIDDIELVLPTKADASDVYTKTEVDTSLAAKANASDLTSTNNRVTALESHVTTAGDVVDFDGHSLHAAGSAVELEKTASGNPVVVDDALPMNAVDVVTAINPIQSGSGTPSPTNVRPISGRSAVNVVDNGKNLQTSQSITVYGIDNKYFRISEDVALPAGTYTSSYFNDSTGKSRLIVNKIIDGAEQTIGSSEITSKSRGSYTFVLDDTYVIRIGGRLDPATTITDSSIFKEFQIEVGNEATPYTQYQPAHTLTKSLGQTVYGGSLNLTTGVGSINNALVTFDGSEDEEWFYSTGTNYHQYFIGIDGCTASSDSITNEFQKIDISQRGQRTGLVSYNDPAHRFALADNELLISDVSAWRTWLANNPVQVCYELATPIPFTVDPEALEMLKGYNRITSDSGNITVKYNANAVQAKADEIQITTNIEMGTKASKAYTVNQFMLRQDGLYKVTANIASGATLTSSNTTKVTITEVLTALLNA